MSKITQQDMLDLLYNKKLPQVYRDEDSKIEFPLKRYLESLIEGGYCGSIEDMEGIQSLVDPMTVPDDFFPYLCDSFGLHYFPDMDISYQRRFLSNVGELTRRRGTYSCIKYLTRALTGLDSEFTYAENGDSCQLFIVLLAKNREQLEEIETSMEVIERYIKYYIPYYVTTVFTFKLANFVVNSKSYSHSAMGSYKFYTIK